MKLLFRGDQKLVAEARRDRAELRISLLFGRFGKEVESVTLRLTAADSSGRSEKRCEITVALKPKGVRVEDTAPKLSVALERAADKAVRSIARALEEEREKVARPGKSPARGKSH
jgi:ribosome-associated translation inhibitor RaiA